MAVAANQAVVRLKSGGLPVHEKLCPLMMSVFCFFCGTASAIQSHVGSVVP